MILYELVVMGDPSTEQLDDLKQYISQAIADFELTLGQEVSWLVRPDDYAPSTQRATAIVFYGSEVALTSENQSLIKHNIPILPVVSDLTNVDAEIPECLRFLNCLSYKDGGVQRVATALLECVGLLPKQRKVFISYRRTEARTAAVQLFDELSSRHFSVFLDSHGIPPAEDFQSNLWQKLCESDVLLMLDTQSYFDSRWTYQEYGRTQSKKIPILRIGWPNVVRSDRTRTARNYDLLPHDINETGYLSENSINDICDLLEAERSKGYAVRSISMLHKLREQLEAIDAEIVGVGNHHSIHVRLPNQIDLTAFPIIGVPNVRTLQNADKLASSKPFAIIYDCIGLHTEYQEHIDWLDTNFEFGRWIQLDKTSWELPTWEESK